MNLFSEAKYPFTDQRFQFEWELLCQGKKYICGVDEAGRGPLAGPVVSAAVVLHSEKLIWQIDDSKKLTENQREDLFELIIENSISYGIGLSSVEEIDEHNILQATVLSMKRAIENLTIHPDFFLIDGNYGIPGLRNSKAIVKGDSRSLTIGAASVLAKVTRDRLMKEIHVKFPEYDFMSNKGYGTASHIDAISKYGLSEYHRKSFKLKRLTNAE